MNRKIAFLQYKKTGITSCNTGLKIIADVDNMLNSIKLFFQVDDEFGHDNRTFNR
ncbi:MAG: hypothetical protein ABFS19_05230 [Thermodesulfobacteriota bacterium]